MEWEVDQPLVSIVMPVFNAGVSLEACLQSVFDQEFEDWELIAMDDCSTDNSLETLRSVNDPRVRVFQNNKNVGPGATRNFLVSQARGQFLVLQDADDLMAPNRIKVQVNALKGNPAVDLIGTNLTLIDSDGLVLGIQRSELTTFSVFDILFKSKAPAHATLAGRSDWFKRNPYPVDFYRAEDKFMIANAVKNDDFSYMLIPEELYLYRISGSIDAEKRLTAYRAERIHLIDLVEGNHLKLLYYTYSWFKTVALSFLQFGRGLFRANA